jgi:hypothetical protein
MQRNQTEDLSWFNLYGLKVKLGYPRIMKSIAISDTGRYELMEDVITGKRFIGPLEYISAGITPGKSYICDYEGSNEIYGFKIK